ncbi:NAD-binding protein, partial [Streptomyces rimosus]|uniref:NAD-binding protein n=1 Tax=Streptomyces rimosus TaxID=1927 RepID=UPI001F39C250
TIVRCGPHGAGQTVKAANQLIVAVNLQACAEAVVFLEKSGVDLTAALEVLGGGLAGSTVLTRKKTNFLNRDFTPGFRIDLHHKDMGIVTDAARTVGAALPVGTLVASLVAALRAQGPHHRLSPARTVRGPPEPPPRPQPATVARAHP